MTHPTFERLQNRCQVSGWSKATTVRGLLMRLKAFGMPPEIKSENKARVKWISAPIHDSSLAQKAMEFVQKENPRKKNIDSSLPKVSDKFFWKEHGFRYKGRYSGYTGSSFIPCYPSYIRVARSGALAELWQCGKLVVRRFAPKGMKWIVDENGAALHDGKMEYHPTVQEFRARNFVGVVKNALKIRRQKEKQLLAKERKNKIIQKVLASKKLLAKHWVTVEDSYQAGNCRLGTGNFVSTLERMLGAGIGAVRADYLMEKFGANDRVKNTVKASVARRVLSPSQ